MDTQRVLQAVYKNLPSPLVWSDVDSIILTGSHAHGTVIDDNDVDVTCVVNPISGQALFGFTPFVQKRVSVPSKDGAIEIAYISIRRLIEHLCGSKISALELLFSPLALFLKEGEAMASVQGQRKGLFTVRAIGPSLMGYVEGQLAAMDHARPNGTNSKRSLALDQFGYDTKAAAHAVRALRMCIELFTLGYFFVDRTGVDASVLKMIKQGRMTLDEVTTIVLREQEQAKMYWENSAGILPEQVDREEAEELLIDVSVRTTTQRYFSWTFSRGFASGIVPGRNLTQAAAERLVDTAIQKSVDTNVGQESAEIGVGGFEKSPNIPGGIAQESPDLGVGKIPPVQEGVNSTNMAGSKESDETTGGIESVTIRQGGKSLKIEVDDQNWVTLPGVKSITIR